MTLEVLDENGSRTINPQGVDADAGLSFPEVVRETTDEGEVV